MIYWFGFIVLFGFIKKGPRKSSPSTFEPRGAGTVATEALTTTTTITTTTTTTTTVPPRTTETKLISKF